MNNNSKSKTSKRKRSNAGGSDKVEDEDKQPVALNDAELLDGTTSGK